ncbi:transglycosylase SLT domain-containing protein [Streptomyces sp. NPDC086182]|uniref:transglycosylase SLT domain-containing protein n=1 Tax=Streptomyces sp. NPDC086182 TaxID=3155058 RepID=UPI003431F3EE
MAGSFRIAEGYVEVSADESAYDRAMQRLKSKKTTVKVGVQLDDKDATAQLGRFLRDRSLNVGVNLDQTALSRLRLPNRTIGILAELSDAARALAEEQLTHLTRDRTVRIIADLDTRTAADDLALLTRARTTRITADADTRVAADDLALLTRSRTVNVRVDVDRSGLAILGSVGGAGSSVGLLSSQFARLAVAALSALPTVTSLGSAIMQMGPAAAIAAPALGSLITAGATLGIGLHGLSDAFTQAFAPATKSAQSATSSLRQVENAERSLAKAQQGVKDAEVHAAEARVQAARKIQDAQKSLKSTISDVADANRRAAESVAQAEQDLTDAQRTARQAQLDLTAARKDAARQLEDLANQQKDIELDRREGVLRVQDAQTELNKVLANPKATQQQRDEAQLTYDEAVQHLNEIQLQQERLTSDAADADRAGVEGSKQVTDAKQKVADANQSITDKTRALKDAEIEQARSTQDGLQKVAKAERDVADAREAARKAAVDGARQIADAQQAVADAARSVTDAQTAGAAATAKTADALAKLSPNARAFVMAVRGLGPAFSNLRMEVQDRLFQGLGDSMTRLGTAAAPAVRSGLVGMAGVLNGMARNLMGTFTRLADQGLLKRMFDGFTNGMQPLTKVPGQMGQAFVQLSIAAAPAFKRITTAMAGESTKISDKLTKAFESGRMEKAIDHAIDVAKKFGRVVADAFGTLRNIMGAASAAGGDALTTLGEAFAELRRVTGLPAMQSALKSIFRAFHEIAVTVTDVVGVALENLVPMLKPFADALGDLAVAVRGPLMNFFQFIGDHQTIFGALASGVLAIVAGMRLWALGTAAVTAAQALLTAVMDANPIGLVVLALAGLAAGLTYAWKNSQTFRDVVTGVWDAIKAAFSATAGWIDEWIIQPFQHLYDVLVGHSIIPDLVNAIVGWFSHLWSETKRIFNELKTWLVNLWNGLWNSVRARWNSFWSGFNSSITGAWKMVRDGFNSLKTGVTNTWNSLWNAAVSKVASIFTTVNGKINNFVSGMKSAFSNLKNALGTIWDGVKSKIGSPIKFVVGSIYNQGIRKMWNTIAGAISSKLTLPAIPLNFNTGGIVPGSGNKDTVPAMLTPGERILSTQQVAKFGGHRAIDAALGASPTQPRRRDRRKPVPEFGDGGIIGTVTGALGSAANWAKGAVLGSLQAAAKKAISAVIRPLINRIPGGGAGIGGLMKGMSNRALDGILGYFGSQDKKAQNVDYKPGAGVAQWAPQIQQALQLLGQSSGWLGTVERRMNQESGGNPTAVNRNDINWQNGTPSVGLMQVIGPTFKAYAGQFRGTGPFMYGTSTAALPNIYAGLNYALHRYGSLTALNRPGGYDSGGLLQPGATLAVNRTGRPERVLDAQQTAMFEQMVNGGGGGVTIEKIEFTVHSLTMPSTAEKKRFAADIVREMKEAIRLSDRSRAR